VILASDAIQKLNKRSPADRASLVSIRFCKISDAACLKSECGLPAFSAKLIHMIARGFHDVPECPVAHGDIRPTGGGYAVQRTAIEQLVDQGHGFGAGQLLAR